LCSALTPKQKIFKTIIQFQNKFFAIIAFPNSRLMKPLRWLFLLVFVLLLAWSATAQPTYDPTALHKIALYDQTRIVGKIIASDSLKIVVQTESTGTVEIVRSQIRSVREITPPPVYTGRFRFRNPVPHRYLLGLSAIPMAKNESHYKTDYGIFHTVRVGASRHFSMGAGTLLIDERLVFSPTLALSPALGFKVTRGLYLGANINWMNSRKSEYLVASAVMTVGSVDHNFTVSYGVSAVPVMMIAGMARISNHTALVTENWVAKSQSFVYSLGFRFFNEQVGGCIGLITGAAILEKYYVGIPYFGLNVKF
jgi:hypothetical protein